MTDPSRNGVPNLRDPECWLVVPWSPTANVHDLVGHFLRFTPYPDAADLEHLAYYEAYVAALDAAYERGPRAYWSSLAERWYHELRGSLVCCLEHYRLRCEDASTTSNWRRTTP